MFFRHLKLEIALAIPALNEWKILWNNSAGQGLTRRDMGPIPLEIDLALPFPNFFALYVIFSKLNDRGLIYIKSILKF